MYFLIEEERIIPGLSLLLKIRGLSIAPVDIITFFALIFQSLCRILFCFSLRDK